MNKFPEKEALGYILLGSGTLCPFGLFPPATEADALGDPLTWLEIKMSPPITMWTSSTNKEALVCPAEFCREKIKKNLSFESHLKSHISQIVVQKGHERLKDRVIVDVTPAAILYLPKIPIKYYCNASACSYRYTVYEGSRYFTRLKYLKQHYFKVHAPKTFACDSCAKTFSTPVFLETHSRMCGYSFGCSMCTATYSTLEALQTHCRRKQHVYDYEKYKDLINTSKQETEKKKAEETLKQKLAAVSLTGNPVPPAKKNNHIPILVPRPKTVTVCGPGGVTSHVTWTYENGSETPTLKVEMATQTIQEPTEQSLNGLSSKNSIFPQGTRQAKRKKSAETQTCKIKLRISTETQTSNLVKRRRSSKKQIKEAETQCPVVEPVIVSSSQNEIDWKTEVPINCSWNTNAGRTSFTSPAATSSANVFSTISLPVVMSLAGIDGSYDNETDVSSMSQAMDVEFQNSNEVPEDISESPTNNSVVTTSEMCVGNRFDEVAQQLFDFEEFHRETQTESDWGTPIDMIDDPVLCHSTRTVEGSISNLLNLATAETQTWTGVPFQRTDVTSTSTSAENATFSIADYVYDFNDLNDFSCGDLNILSANAASRNSSPSFLETVDNETQTPLMTNDEFACLMGTPLLGLDFPMF